MQTPQMHNFFKQGISKQQPLFDINCDFFPIPTQEQSPIFYQNPHLPLSQCMQQKQNNFLFSSRYNYDRNCQSCLFKTQPQFQKLNQRIGIKRQQIHTKIRENYIQAFKQKQRKILMQKNHKINQFQKIHEKLRMNKLQFKRINQVITFIFNSIEQCYEVIARLHIVEGLVIVISKNLSFKNAKNLSLIQDFCYLMNKCIEWYIRRNFFLELVENSLQVVYLIFSYLMNEQQYFPEICNLLTNLSASHLMDAQKYRIYWQNGEVLERIIHSPRKCQNAFVELLYSFYSGNNKPTMKPLKDRFIQLTRIFQMTLRDEPYLTAFLISRLQFIPDSLLQLLQVFLKQSLQKRTVYKIVSRQVSSFCLPNQMDQQNMQVMQINQKNEFNSNQKLLFDETIMLLCEILYRQMKINENDLSQIFVGWKIDELIDRFEQDQ